MVKILPDTHLLLWSADADHPGRLPSTAAAIMANPANDLYFSAASIWEVSIKRGLGRRGLVVDPHALYLGLLDNGYIELKISSVVSFGVLTLPHIHKDPFDRLLIAQAAFEDCLLLTADPTIAKYPGQIRLV
jgi:PIN domain nuclease of toxin-antitoxin system